MSAKELRQGDSLDLDISLEDGTVLTDWTCQLQLRDSAGSAEINRAITDYNADNTSFVGLITGAETSSLEVGSIYTVSAQLSHAASGRSVELSKKLFILPQDNY